MLEDLTQNFKEVFHLPDDAINWLLTLFTALQVFDDAADDDPIDRKELNETIWFSLVGQFQNSFFITNSASLLPVIATMILKWQASDTVERSGEADARSYCWRAGYYDVVMMVVYLVHGKTWAANNAHLVMGLYGENFDGYLEEFKHA